MDNLNKPYNLGSKSQVADAASDLLHEGKKLANELYDEGLNKVSDLYDKGRCKVDQAEEAVKVYSDELLQKVQENPLAAILIAGGIGFLLSKMLK